MITIGPVVNGGLFESLRPEFFASMIDRSSE